MLLVKLPVVIKCVEKEEHASRLLIDLAPDFKNRDKVKALLKNWGLKSVKIEELYEEVPKKQHRIPSGVLKLEETKTILRECKAMLYVRVILMNNFCEHIKARNPDITYKHLKDLASSLMAEASYYHITTGETTVGSQESVFCLAIASIVTPPNAKKKEISDAVSNVDTCTAPVFFPSEKRLKMGDKVDSLLSARLSGTDITNSSSITTSCDSCSVSQKKRKIDDAPGTLPLPVQEHALQHASTVVSNQNGLHDDDKLDFDPIALEDITPATLETRLTALGSSACSEFRDTHIFLESQVGTLLGFRDDIADRCGVTIDVGVIQTSGGWIFNNQTSSGQAIYHVSVSGITIEAVDLAVSMLYSIFGMAKPGGQVVNANDVAKKTSPPVYCHITELQRDHYQQNIYIAREIAEGMRGELGANLDSIERASETSVFLLHSILYEVDMTLLILVADSVDKVSRGMRAVQEAVERAEWIRDLDQLVDITSSPSPDFDLESDSFGALETSIGEVSQDNHTSTSSSLSTRTSPQTSFRDTKRKLAAPVSDEMSLLRQRLDDAVVAVKEWLAVEIPAEETTTTSTTTTKKKKVYEKKVKEVKPPRVKKAKVVKAKVSNIKPVKKAVKSISRVHSFDSLSVISIDNDRQFDDAILFANNDDDEQSVMLGGMDSDDSDFDIESVDLSF
eukprot:gene28843-35781_t